MLQLINGGVVVHEVGPFEMASNGGVPSVWLNSKSLRDLGFGHLLNLEDSETGELYWSKGDETRQVAVALTVRADAERGGTLELTEGVFAKTKRKVVAIKALRSTGVADKPATMGAEMRFVLLAHASVAGGGAGGGGDGGGGGGSRAGDKRKRGGGGGDEEDDDGDDDEK
jgi:hypothetical protein